MRPRRRYMRRQGDPIVVPNPLCASVPSDLSATTKEEWVEVDHSNRVTARWVFLREIQRRHRKAAHLCDIELPKFDVMIEYNSPAAEATPHWRTAPLRRTDNLWINADRFSDRF
jgi:hypothetical protein